MFVKCYVQIIALTLQLSEIKKRSEEETEQVTQLEEMRKKLLKVRLDQKRSRELLQTKTLLNAYVQKYAVLRPVLVLMFLASIYVCLQMSRTLKRTNGKLKNYKPITINSTNRRKSYKPNSKT